jgi:hypothetical protein
VEAAGSVERSRRRRGGLGIAVVIAVALVGLLVGIGLAGDGDDGGGEPTSPRADRGPAEMREPVARGHSLMITARAEVWVCLIGGEEELIDGRILLPGEEQGPFRAGRFLAAFGNGEVEMVIDGETAEISASSSPVGYEIDSDGELSELVEGERPSCE